MNKPTDHALTEPTSKPDVLQHPEKGNVYDWMARIAERERNGMKWGPKSLFQPAYDVFLGEVKVWAKAQSTASKPENIGGMSDGYHTFNELYDHRNALFAALLNSHPKQSFKTWRDDNGIELEGWFIAGMNTPVGQISYHMPSELWDLIRVTEIDFNEQYDEHESNDVIERLWILFSDKPKEGADDGAQPGDRSP